MNSLTILSALVVSILWHEACHALALLAFDVPIQVIQIGAPEVYRRGIFSLGLIPFVGRVGADLADVPKTTQAMYLASGPAGSLLLGVGAILLGIILNVFFMKMLGVVSLTIGIFNLIPVPPLDGYRLVALVVRVPYRAQVLWAVLGWIAILMATVINFYR